MFAVELVERALLKLLLLLLLPYTNQGASNLRVTLIDQSSYAAKVVGAEPDKDVAVLELDAPADVIKSLKPITVGRSSRLLVRQCCI